MQDRMTFVRNLKVKVIHGGHHLHSDLPEETASVIVDFIKANGKYEPVKSTVKTDEDDELIRIAVGSSSSKL